MVSEWKIANCKCCYGVVEEVWSEHRNRKSTKYYASVSVYDTDLFIKRPANNSQVNYKKFFSIKNGMTNRPFQNTNGYKIWIY